MNIKYLLAAAATYLLSSCGGGTSNSTSSAISPTLYGFSSNGGAYVANIDLARKSYSYQSIDLNNGAMSGVNRAALEPDANLADTYKIYGHGSHRLALDADQTLFLASVLPSAGNSPLPAVFPKRPLTNFNEIAGSYYLTTNGPYWLRLDIAANGSVVLACEDKTIVERLENPDGSFFEDSFNACDSALRSSLKAKIELGVSPFFKVETSYQSTYDPTLPVTIKQFNVLFSQTSAGKLAYVDLASTPDPFFGKSLTAWKEKINFNDQNTWAGQWLFNRDYKGDSGSLSLSASQTGTSSLGYFITKMPRETATQYRLPLLGTRDANFIFYAGISSLSLLSPHFASDAVGYAPSAIFSNSVQPNSVTYSWPAQGTRGPYLLPERFYDGLVDGRFFSLEIEVFSRSEPDKLVKSILLRQDDDYSVDLFTRQFLLSAPLASVDENLNLVSLKATFQSSPVDLSISPKAFGIRLK